jgi:hypothetical protein
MPALFTKFTKFTKLGSLTHPQRSQRGSWGLNKAKTQLDTSTSSEESVSETDKSTGTISSALSVYDGTTTRCVHSVTYNSLFCGHLPSSLCLLGKVAKQA